MYEELKDLLGQIQSLNTIVYDSANELINALKATEDVEYDFSIMYTAARVVVELHSKVEDTGYYVTYTTLETNDILLSDEEWKVKLENIRKNISKETSEDMETNRINNMYLNT